MVLENNFEILGQEPVNSQLGGVVVLDGLIISGAAIEIPEINNGLRELHLRHCTLVPGLSLQNNGQASEAGQASLIVKSSTIKIEIESCILGPIQISEGAEIKINNSIIDANAKDAVAYSGLEPLNAGGDLTITNSNVIGKLHTRIMRLASNCIFDGQLGIDDEWKSPVLAERKQQGCVRFSYVPLNGRLPKRFRCQPEFAINQAVQKAQAEQETNLSALKKAQISSLVSNRISPVFTDTRYGQAGYMQLAISSAREIVTGADDESEMGVFHDLFQPQREINLKLRLKEYLRFGLEAGIFYET